MSGTETGITGILSAFSADIALETLPASVVDRARFLVLDLVGNIVRARHDAESTASFLAAARAMGMAGGDFGVFGDNARYSPLGAAFLNGALAHSLDFDDTHAAGSLHPGAPVIPAAIAAGEMVGASGATVLAAIIAGYEVTCRIALALPAGDHYNRGFHPTATCGAFGAAAAAGRVFGFNADQIAGAFGTVLSQAAGSLEFLVNGAWTKRFQVGWAASNGLMAATLVREGFKGAAQAFEGPHGFLKAYAPNPVPERAVQDLGTVFELMHTAVKPYPSCRYGHASVDAALALRAANDLRADEIESVRLGLPHAGMLLVGQPADKKQNPQNVVDGQFSGPFVVASALTTGAMGWDSYRLLQDPAIRAMMPRITSEFDPEIEAEYPANMSGKVTIRARGRDFVQKVVIPKGEPDNFLTEAELRAKFAGLTDAVLGSERAARLADGVLAIHEVEKIGSLVALSHAGVGDAAGRGITRVPNFTAGSLYALTHRIASAMGSEPDEAAEVADHLVRANLAGHDSHGVGMIPTYVRLLQGKLLVPNQELETVLDAGALLVLDARRGYGQRMAANAVRRAIARARETGACVLALRNSAHIGRIGTYAELAASAGMAFTAFVNVADHHYAQATWGAAEAKLGTNPFCAAVPGPDGVAAMLDMASTTIAGGKVRVAYNTGKQLPEGALIDAEGRPTTDPAGFTRDRTSALTAFGKHKGSGMAIMAELMVTAIAGGQRADETPHGGVLNSMLATVIDTSRLGGVEAVGRSAAATRAHITSARPAPGFSEVLMPGDPERRYAATRLQSGIEVDDTTWADVRAAAVSLGISEAEIDALVAAPAPV